MTSQASPGDTVVLPDAVAPQPWTGGPLKVSVDGVGPLTPATPFDPASARKAFPTARVDAAFLHDAARATPILVVSDASGQMLQVEQGAEGRIGRIRVQGGPAQGPGGEFLLQPFASAGFQLSDCRVGSGSDIGAVVCARRSAESVAFVFGVPGWTRGDRKPPADLVAQKGFLREIIWTPPY